MAKGVMRSTKTRDGIAASLADNVGYLEELYYGLEEDTGDALDAATAASTAAAAAIADVESGLTEMDSILESLSLSRASRINRPNLLKQNFWTSRNMPTSAVIEHTITIPVEDATAAAAAITDTCTDNAITSSYVIHGMKCSNWSVVSGAVTATFSSGSAAITVAARSGAHDAAVTLTLYLCTVAATNVVYGEASRISGTSYPYMKSIGSSDYPGHDTGDGVVCSVADIAAADQITEADGETYTKAIQYAITAKTAWGNAEYLMYFYPNASNKYYQGNTPRDYGQIAEMTPGKRYTMSCWVRVLSGDGVWLKMGYGNSYSNDPYNDNTNHRSGVSASIEVAANSGEWQRVSWTFDFNPVGDWYTETSAQVTVNNETVTQITRTYNWHKKVCFGVQRKYTATVQICGFRLTEGGLWLPTKYDELSDRLDDEVDTLEGTISGSVAIAKAALLAIVAESDTATAAASHAVGELFVMGDTLYKCTVAIATGETITPGTNCTATTLADEIAAAAPDLSGYATTAALADYATTADLADYAPKANPEFTGSIGLYRKSGTTVGVNSMAIGTDTEASGFCSQAVGYNTTATGKCQNVSGMYNKPDSEIAAHDSSESYNIGAVVYTAYKYKDFGVWWYGKLVYICTAANSGDTYSSLDGVLPAAHWERLYTAPEQTGSYPDLPFDTIHAEIVGIGRSGTGNTKNGRTLDWSGNEEIAGTFKCTGKITIGSTILTEANLQALLAMLT